MEVDHNPRHKKKRIPTPNTSIALTTPTSEVIPMESSDMMTLQRERWNTQHNTNQYEKIKLTMGHTCIKKGLINYGLVFTTLTLVIIVIIILTHTMNKINYLEIKMLHVEEQITNNINSIKAHHNSTFKHLEERHNELKNIVKNNAMLIASRGMSSIRRDYELFLTSITLTFIHFGKSNTFW